MFVKSNIYKFDDVCSYIEDNNFSDELCLGHCRSVESNCTLTDTAVVQISDDKTIRDLFEYLTVNEPMDIMYECDDYLMCTDKIEVYTLEVFDMVELDF